MAQKIDIEKPKKSKAQPNVDLNPQVQSDYMEPDPIQAAMIKKVKLNVENVETEKIKKGK